LHYSVRRALAHVTVHQRQASAEYAEHIEAFGCDKVRRKRPMIHIPATVGSAVASLHRRVLVFNPSANAP
jgi:hypothetical protein